MKPNIIIVMTDQQRADLRASRGYPLDTTPFLDQWAEGGVDFDAAYTSNPTCMPARVSMFTGRYPSCHRVRTNHNAEDAYYTKDLLDLMKESGYRTALCGKNHSHRKPSDFDFFRCNGHLGNEDGEDKTEAERSFGRWLTATKHMESHEPAPGGVRVQHPYRNVSDALDFIDETGKDTPFFLWLSFAEPHNPYQVPAPYFDMFPPESLPLVDTGAEDLPGKGARYEWMRRQWEETMPDNIEARILRARSNYHGMLRLIDDQFKRLIAGLEERGIADDTIVVFLSDHGDFAGEYGLIRKGADLPEALARIPMAWRGPGVAELGIQSGACVNIVDILPTLCEMTGIASPAGCQGRSLLPLLGGEAVPGEFDIGYCENGFSGLYWTDGDGLTPAAEGARGEMTSFDCLNTWSQCGQVRMVRRGDYKLQLDMMGDGYLYNLREDPREVHNLWDDPGEKESRLALLALLASEMMKRSDPLPYPRRRYRVKLHPRGYWNQELRAEDPGVIFAP